MYPNPYPPNNQGGFNAPPPNPGYPVGPPQGTPYPQPGFNSQPGIQQPYGSVPTPNYPQQPGAAPSVPYPVSPAGQYPASPGYPATPGYPPSTGYPPNPGYPPSRPDIGFGQSAPAAPNQFGQAYPGPAPTIYQQSTPGAPQLPQGPPYGGNFAPPATQVGHSPYGQISSQAYSLSSAAPSSTGVPPTNIPATQIGHSPYGQNPSQAHSLSSGIPSSTGVAHTASKQITMATYQETPTLRDAHYDPGADAQALRKAMKGFGTDETGLINVLAKRTNAQRLQIASTYKSMFGKDLVRDLKSETSGRFEEVLVKLLTPRFDYIAERLHDATAGIGTKEGVLIDVLCTASNQELQWIQATYHRLYQKPLEKDIVADTSGHFQRILVSMCTAQRNEDPRIDASVVTQDANALYQAGMKKWGTDESVFNMIMAHRSFPHLRAVFQEYEKVSGQDIERTINAEFSGDIKTAMNAIVKSVKHRASYFAQRLHDAMSGMGTNDDALIFLIITRSEIDLENIKVEYNRLYKKSLAQDISSETSGDYKKTLITLLN